MKNSRRAWQDIFTPQGNNKKLIKEEKRGSSFELPRLVWVKIRLCPSPPFVLYYFFEVIIGRKPNFTNLARALRRNNAAKLGGRECQDRINIRILTTPQSASLTAPLTRGAKDGIIRQLLVLCSFITHGEFSPCLHRCFRSVFEQSRIAHKIPLCPLPP